MELNQAYKDIEKYLEQINQDLKFKKDFETESSVAFSGEKGIYRLVHDSKTNILSLECAYENNGEQTNLIQFRAVCLNLMLLMTGILSLHQTRLLTSLKGCLRFASR